MLELFKTYLSTKIQLSKEELDYWISLLELKKVSRHDYLLREGEISKQLIFVCNGCLRLYSIDAKGREHILQFAPENWWVGDVDSFSNNKPSLYYIDALEDSDVLTMDPVSNQLLFDRVPQSAIFFQKLMQNRQAATQKRIIYSMSASAEERYTDFLKTYPSFSQRMPLHMIASYLGITPESLSRIRKQLVTKKT
jgi:CRP-like cAMP-binding protein